MSESLKQSDKRDEDRAAFEVYMNHDWPLWREHLGSPHYHEKLRAFMAGRKSCALSHVARFYCQAGGCAEQCENCAQEAPASVASTTACSGELDMSPAARLKDAEDDVLRLRLEKMKFFERVIELERDLATERGRVEYVQGCLREAQAKASALSATPLFTPAQIADWLDSNTTHYDVQPDGPEVCTAGANIPVLAAVSKRIWYHATDDQEPGRFSQVVARALNRADGGKQTDG